MVAGKQDVAREHLRGDPTSGVLHQVLAEHLETFLALSAADGLGPSLPRHVEHELRVYLRCGILAHGFARFHCFGCGTDTLVAFSCKGRGFCPSCGGRRMAESAAHLVDHVLPHVPVRQWVLSFPSLPVGGADAARLRPRRLALPDLPGGSSRSSPRAR